MVPRVGVYMGLVRFRRIPDTPHCEGVKIDVYVSRFAIAAGATRLPPIIAHKCWGSPPPALLTRLGAESHLGRRNPGQLR